METTKDIEEKHNTAAQLFKNVDYFYQRALLDSMNLSIGIFITLVMLYKMRK
jgi:hypothetical protein